MMKQTNYLDPEGFKKFIQAIPKLPVYHSYYRSLSALSPEMMQLLFKVLYYCALRISEVINLQKDDFDLEHRILRVRQAKTGRKKGKMKADGTQIVKFEVQETSIPKPLLEALEVPLSQCPGKVFNISRQTAWSYCKKAGDLSGVNIFEKQKKRAIKGFWTHLFRKAYAKMMYQGGANGALIDVKLRHEHKSKDMADSTFTYIKPDVNALIQWESDHFGE